MPSRFQLMHVLHIVGSVKVNFFSNSYRADKSTIFGRGAYWALLSILEGEPR